jgi:hypothetical protein
VEEVRKKCEALKRRPRRKKVFAARARLWTARTDESFSVQMGYSF